MSASPPLPSAPPACQRLPATFHQLLRLYIFRLASYFPFFFHLFIGSSVFHDPVKVIKRGNDKVCSHFPRNVCNSDEYCGPCSQLTLSRKFYTFTVDILDRKKLVIIYLRRGDVSAAVVKAGKGCVRFGWGGGKMAKCTFAAASRAC